MVKRSGGINPHVGLLSQNWAALSLYIQACFDRSFEYIRLEGVGLADFALYFKGKKIVCESKNYKTAISYSKLKEILRSIASVNKDDEVLIICTKVSESLLYDLGNINYPKISQKFAEDKGFGVRELAMLPRVKFWVVDSNFNEEAAKNLLLQRFQFWLPDEEASDIINSLLIEKIYKNSSIGGFYYRNQFENDVKARIKLLRERQDYKDAERSAIKKVEDTFKKLDSTDDSLKSSAPLAALVADRNLHHYVLTELERRKSLKIPQWSAFWEATYSSMYDRQVLRIFESRMKTKTDAKFCLDFIGKNMSKIKFKLMDEYEFKSASDVVMKARSIDPKLDIKAADTIVDLYKLFDSNDLYLLVSQNKNKDNWIKEEFTKSLAAIYRTTDFQKVRRKILDFFEETFNLSADNGVYLTETPKNVFEIFREYIGADPNELDSFIKLVVQHYDRQYSMFSKKKNKQLFNGRDWIGGGVSNFGGDFSTHDGAFINLVIRPVLRSMETEKSWEFINRYISVNEKDISRAKPDFMNRASIPFILDQYKNGPHNTEAAGILRGFIKQRTIPHKAEIIYEYINNDAGFNLDEKWRLLSIGIEIYKYPINIFMEQILWQLLGSGHGEALSLLENLLTDPEYMSRQTSMLETSVPQSIGRVLSNEKTFNRGVVLLKKYLGSVYFTKKLGRFDAYDVKVFVLMVIKKDETKGFEILKSLIGDKPTPNEQAVFGTVFREMPDDILLSAYKKILLPMVEAENVSLLSKRISNSYAREELIWFAEKLVKKKLFKEAYILANYFLDDPDPKPNSERDKEVKAGKYDLTINTVRGCLPWIAINTCTVPGRKYIDEAFSLIEKLCKDPSPYVRQHALLGLEALANVRHSTMPGNKKDWYMSPELAEQIEALAFEILNEPENSYPAIMKNLARVFNRVRSLDEKQAVYIWNEFAKKDPSSLEDLNGWLIFMAEFREKAFNNWDSSRSKIAKYNAKPIKLLLEETLQKGADELRQNLAWHFWKLTKDANVRDYNSMFKISLKYLTLITSKYGHDAFTSIYHFIDDNIDKRFDECYSLWHSCLVSEREELLKLSKQKSHDYYWWPHAYNGKILVKVLHEKGQEQFMSDLDLILGYPEDTLIAYDLDLVADNLATIDNKYKKRIESIFEKLVKRNSSYFVQYKKWQDKK